MSTASPPCHPTSVSSARRTAICATWWRVARSAKTCGVASASFRFTCRHCATGAKTSLSWRCISPRERRRVWSESLPCRRWEDLDLLLAYDWPGNVRELAAVIERAVILGAGRTLRITAALGPASSGAAVSTPATDPIVLKEETTAIETIDAAMRRHIEAALRATGGRVEGPHGAPRQLQINPHTLRARMKKARH